MTTCSTTDHPTAALGLRMLSAVLADDEPTALSLVHPDHVDHAPAGDLHGVPATGRRFVTRAVHIWRVEDGLLAEHWMFRDDIAALRQLGAGR